MFVHLFALGAHFFPSWAPLLTPFAQDLDFDAFLGALWDSFGRAMGGLLEPLGVSWGLSREPSWALWAHLGLLWGPSGALWASIGRLLESFRLFGPLSGPSWTAKVLFGASFE